MPTTPVHPTISEPHITECCSRSSFCPSYRALASGATPSISFASKHKRGRHRETPQSTVRQAWDLQKGSLECPASRMGVMDARAARRSSRCASFSGNCTARQPRTPFILSAQKLATQGVAEGIFCVRPPAHETSGEAAPDPRRLSNHRK
eukprot:COSAG03_NODE_4478_length_1539_cov_12.654167_3_plen_149_part_00